MAEPATPTTDEDTGYRLRQDVEHSGTLPNHVDAGHAATTVLCTLATRLSHGEVAKLAAALPETLAVILRYCPRPTGDAGEAFDGDGFMHRVAGRLQVTAEVASEVTRAVFAAVRVQLSAREAQDAAAQLPKDLRELWLGDEPFAPSVPLPPRAHPVPPDPLPSPDEVPDLVGRGMLAEIEADGSVPEGHTSLDVAAAVLGALARRVTGGEARAFIDALPPILQQRIGPAAVHDESHVEHFDHVGMRDDVAARLDIWPQEADALIQLVFDVARVHVRPKEIDHVASQLPRDLKERWLGRRH